MIVHYSTPAEEDLAYWRQHSKKITQRIESLIKDIRQHPFLRDWEAGAFTFSVVGILVAQDQ